MNLYTERHGLRKPIARKSKISKEVYTLLLNTCQKYYKNLTHIFKLQQHCSFVDQYYIQQLAKIQLRKYGTPLSA